MAAFQSSRGDFLHPPNPATCFYEPANQEGMVALVDKGKHDDAVPLCNKDTWDGTSVGSSTRLETDGDQQSDLEAPDMKPTQSILSRSQRSACVGFCAQYFAVGLIYGGIPATTYGVFLGYLNVPAYVYATVSVVTTLPWSFKFLFGLINDTLPISGLRRKPYMIFGWGFCALVLLVLANTPLPPPYWCVDAATGDYVRKRTLPDGGAEPAVPCHPQSAEQGGKYAVLLMLAALGYVIADVAADGLTTEYAKAEPLDRRGATQTTAYLTRTIGQVCATLFIGICMNSKQYNGSWSWGLSFETVCFCLAVPAALMVPISAWLVEEPSATKAAMSCGQYAVRAWDLLQSKACFYVILYCVLSGVTGMTTTAQAQVKQQWAGVQNFQNQMFSLIGHVLFASGLWLVRKHFLQTSWRMMLAVTTLFLQVVDCAFSTLTIFAVVRNQYFFLGEAVLTEVPSAANFMVAFFVIVEMADDGNEGMVYGLLSTAINLGRPFGRAMGNQVYRLFEPNLSDAANYIRDAPEFRRTVFASFMLSYGVALASLGLLFLLPDQKAEAQQRKREWPKRSVYGLATIALLSSALLYSLLVNFLSMSPSTMCLQFAGGNGCDNAQPHRANGTLSGVAGISRRNSTTL